MDADNRPQAETPQQNELEAALTKLKTLDSNTKNMILAFLAIIAIIGAYKVYRWNIGNTIAEQCALADSAYLAAGNDIDKARETLPQMREFIGDASGAAEPYTRMQTARLLAMIAYNTEDEAERETMAKEAIDTLKPMMTDESLSPSLAGPALFTAAQLHETIGQFEEAKTIYEELKKDRFVGTPYQSTEITGDKALVQEYLDNIDEIAKPVTLVEKKEAPKLEPTVTPRTETSADETEVVTTETAEAADAEPAEAATPEETPAETSAQ